MPEQQLFPAPPRDLAERRKNLIPKTAEAFRAFSQTVFAEGALSPKTKQLIAVAVAHVTQCPYLNCSNSQAGNDTKGASYNTPRVSWKTIQLLGRRSALLSS